MPTTVPVTADNFTRAETDLVFASTVERGGFGRWHHHRDQMPVDYPVIRPNRDTLYSEAVFDLDAGPVTITLPEAGRRFLSLQVINEDHYTPTVVYTAGRYTFTRDQIGTRMSCWRSASWSTRPTQTTSPRFTSSRTRSASPSPAAPGAGKSRPGTQPATSGCGMRC
jgi:hypothetical protein